MTRVDQLARHLRHLGLKLPAFPRGVLLRPPGKHHRPLIVGGLEDCLEIFSQPVTRVIRLRYHVARYKLPFEQEDGLNAAQLPKRFDPVVPAFTVQLSMVALKDANVTGDMGRSGAVTELRSGSRSGEPAVSLVVKQGENRISQISPASKIKARENARDLLFGHALKIVRDCGASSLRALCAQYHHSIMQRHPSLPCITDSRCMVLAREEYVHGKPVWRSPGTSADPMTSLLR
jgi:hypothetical protein